MTMSSFSNLLNVTMIQRQILKKCIAMFASSTTHIISVCLRRINVFKPNMFTCIVVFKYANGKHSCIHDLFAFPITFFQKN